MNERPSGWITEVGGTSAPTPEHPTAWRSDKSGLDEQRRWYAKARKIRSGHVVNDWEIGSENQRERFGADGIRTVALPMSEPAQPEEDEPAYLDDAEIPAEPAWTVELASDQPSPDDDPYDRWARTLAAVEVEHGLSTDETAIVAWSLNNPHSGGWAARAALALGWTSQQSARNAWTRACRKLGIFGAQADEPRRSSGPSRCDGQTGHTGGGLWERRRPRDKTLGDDWRWSSSLAADGGPAALDVHHRWEATRHDHLPARTARAWGFTTITSKGHHDV